jgi:biotin carboxyl carrier protein
VIPLPPFRLVTAPSDARVASVAPTGSVVAPGDVVAMLDGPRATLSVLAPVHGRIGGALAGASQRVASGEGIVWIER